MSSVPSWLRRPRIQNRLEKMGMATGVVPSHRSYKKFVILGRGRSGSNLLATSLSSHSNVVNFGELFNNNARKAGPIHFQYPGYKGNDKKLIAQRDNQPLKFLDENVFGSYPKRIQAVGFKLFYYHAQEPEWRPIWDYLQDQQVHALHIQRRNSLQALVSQRLAEITRTWSESDKGNRSSTGAYNIQLTLSVFDCEHHFSEIEKQRHKFGSYFGSTLEIAYEDIVENYDLAFERVQEFLGLKVEKLKSPLRKQEKREMADVISNFEELKVAFSDSQWAHFFETS